MPRLPNDPDLSTCAGRIGAEIRRRRLGKKLTVERAAAKARIAPKTWYNRESGRRFDIEDLPAIAAAVGCRPGQLLGRKDA